MNLRAYDYEISNWGTVLAVADYHNMKCLTESKNDWELSYTVDDPATTTVDEEQKLC